jgi:hypothetical protein
MFRGLTTKRRNRWGNGDTGNAFIMFQQPIDPECKEDVRIMEQFLENIDGLIMNGLRRGLAAAEARVLAGDAGAVGDAEFLFISIRRRLHDRDAIRREVIAWIIRVHNQRAGTMCRAIDAAYEVEEGPCHVGGGLAVTDL